VDEGACGRPLRGGKLAEALEQLGEHPALAEEPRLLLLEHGEVVDAVEARLCVGDDALEGFHLSRVRCAGIRIKKGGFASLLFDTPRRVRRRGWPWPGSRSSRTPTCRTPRCRRGPCGPLRSRPSSGR